MYYTSEQIITVAKRQEGFTHIPQGYWLAYIRRNLHDQKPNEFNDVCHLMHGEKLVHSQTCTTVPGLPALKGGYKKYNKYGAAIIASGVWMYDAFNYGLHNGRMPALRQVKDIWIYRDGDMDNKAEQIGNRVKGMWHTNIHGVTYNFLSNIVRKFIGQWSYGCIVHNVNKDYRKMINLTKEELVSVIIIDEFGV